MKILIARINHETNTFSPLPTPLESFGHDGPALNQQAYDENINSRTAMTAFIHAAEEINADIITPISAMAFPSGKVDKNAFEFMCDQIVDSLQGCDALMLDLHGAMTVDGYDDGEGELLRRIREKSPDVPIAIALDLHGNITEEIVSAVDILVGFKTYPHIDMYETGARAARLLMQKLDGKINPTISWQLLPLMSHTLSSATTAGAMQEAVKMATEAEQDSVLAVSVFSGFALSDIPSPSMSVITVTDNDIDKAHEVTSTISNFIWQNRTGFTYESEELSSSISRAYNISKQNVDTNELNKPILLLDHSDNCMSGGTCDTMDVLQECLKQGLHNIAVGPICDPEAVQTMIQAGVGETITIALGNKVELTQLGVTKSPLALTGQIKAITDGEFIVKGPTYTGQTWRMGKTAVLKTEQATIVVVETPQEPLDLGVFTSVGIDPSSYSFLLMKSRMYCRPVFEPICSAVIECDAVGVTSSNYELFNFTRLARPIYPFDLNMEMKF